MRPFVELSDSGLLWLINRQIFHPRGYALALQIDDNGTAVGWELHGDGSEPFTFQEDTEREHFTNANNTFKEARNAAFWGHEQS